ncbi:MAG TPA: ATP-binding protein [Azospirillaceae bacterium]|nr:ATP-binding protein [Azospirillaceae bacterium]
MRFSALLRQGYVGRNPNTGDFLHHLQDGYERVAQRSLSASRHSTRSTAASFALVGCSGIGKTKSMERILGMYPQVIHHSEPFSLDQVVWLKLDCPYMGSPKQLCISFFKEMDVLLGTRYLPRYGAGRMSIDEMMVHMAHVANLHAVGVLVIDEIQHLRQARGAGPDALLNLLVTLVNTIGIPVIIIGTLGALPLLQGDFRQARRASGLGSLVWERLEHDSSWNHFIDRMWQYQWTQEHTPLTDDIRLALYEESQGIIDIVIKLFMLAQLHIIQLRATRGRPERLDAGLLRQTARENFHLIRPMIDALKTGSRDIDKYDDIRPLEMHVQQVFHDTTIRLTPQVSTGTPNRRAENKTTDTTPADMISETALRALEELGVSRDIGAALLAQALAQNPGADAFSLMASITAQLQQRCPGTEPKPKRKSTLSPKVKEPAEEDDLRSIVEKGKSAGMTGYEALSSAGVIKPPMQDFAV